jgi:hypothetical protein
MRTSAWVTILGLAGLAVACGDQPTEVVPDREEDGLRGGGTIALATASSGDGYSITTDKDDYQPGDVVHLTGAGWEPEDILDIVLTDEPQTHPPLRWSVTVEANGTFTDATYTVDEGDLNVTFTLVATSRSSGQSLSMTFTDGNLNAVTLTPATVFVQPTATASTTIDVTIVGNSDPCTVTLNLLASPALPAGVGTSIPNNVFTTNANFSRTLNFTTSGVTPGSYPFILRATRGADCQGNGNVDVNGTLVVFGAATKLAYGQGPSNTTGGGTITPAVTVRVLDVNNNLVANSSAIIQMAIQNNAGGGTLTGTLTLAAVGGIATFNDLSIDKIGTGYTLRATSGALTSVTSSNFNITLGAAAKLGFTVQPTGANTNANLGTQPRVAVLDAGGNIRTSGTGSGATITLAVTPGTGTGTLTCTTNPLNASNGVAIFAGCKINLAGTGYRLRATSPGLTLIDSDPFNINNADNSAPTVNCTVPDLTIWYATDVQVPCTASDASGLANAADASFTLSTNVAAGTETANALTNTRNVCDTLNNCVLVGFTFKVDKKSPVVTCASADGIWHSDNVSIHCTATDGGAGLANSADASFNLLTTVAIDAEDANAATGSRSVADAVGNAATAGPVAGNKVDKKDPTVSCGSADGNWHADNVSIACTASDGGSGLANAADASFNLVTSVGPNTENPNASTNSRSVADAVGHTTPAGPITGNKVDKKAPTVSCGTADADWHGGQATIPCTASDAGSGLAEAGDASFDLTTNVADGTEDQNASTNSRSILDGVGNSSTAGPVDGNKVDKKKPMVTCDAADANWHADNVSIHCSASDGGSGLNAAGDASFNLTTSVADGDETEFAETDSRDVADKVGNTRAAGPVENNKIDRKAPEFTCNVAPAAWSANDVTRNCVAADGGSGLTPTTDATFSLHTNVAAGSETDDAQTNTKQLADALGNKNTAGPLGSNKVDKKDPEVSCGNADGNWHAADVSIPCTGADGGSGLANAGDASFNLVTNVAANTETATASTDSRSVADVVGHSVTAGPVAGNKVDKKAPVVSCGGADGAWHSNNVSIKCTSTEGGSGLQVAGDATFYLMTNVAMGSETATASTNSHDVADAVGNSSTGGPVAGNKIDRKAPQVTCGNADAIWHANDVSIGCTASDGGSGLANAGDASFNLSTSVAAGTETANASTNSRSVADVVGNSETGGPISGNQIDKKGPTLSLTCPNSPLLLNQPNVPANWTAADGGSGVAAGFTAGYFVVSTNPAGPHTVFAAAGLSHDAVGNTSSASAPCGYTVSFGFAGFTTPVDMNNVMNGANSGQAIPLKWTLKDFNGAPVTTLTNVNVTAVTLSCSQGSTADLIEEYAAGASGLINQGNGSYQFNWKTPTSYAKSCKTLRLDLGEGTTQNPVYHTALFEFKK